MQQQTTSNQEMKHEMNTGQPVAGNAASQNISGEAPDAQGGVLRESATQQPVTLQVQQGGYQQLLVPAQIQSVIPIVLPIIYPHHSSVANSFPAARLSSNIGQNVLNYPVQMPSISSNAAERAEECKTTQTQKLNEPSPLSSKTATTTTEATTMSTNKSKVPIRKAPSSPAQKPGFLESANKPILLPSENLKRARRTLRGRKPPALPTAASRTQQHVKPLKKRPLITRKSDVSDAEEISNQEPGNLVASSDNAAAVSTVTSGAEEVLNSSKQLAYCWDSLGLGKELGSPALNEYVRLCRSREGLSNENLPYVSAQQVLQIIQSFQMKTLLPPPGSGLHRIVKKNPFENRPELYGSDGESEGDNESEYEDGVRDAKPLPYLQGDFDAEKHDEDDDAEKTQLPTTANGHGTAREHGATFKKPNLPPRPKRQRQNNPPQCKIPFKTMARLYETMCAQDADDGSANRREAQYLTAEACIDKLRSFENLSCELKLEEAKVLQRGRKLGLATGLLPDYAPFNPSSMTSNSSPIDQNEMNNGLMSNR